MEEEEEEEKPPQNNKEAFEQLLAKVLNQDYIKQNKDKDENLWDE